MSEEKYRLKNGERIPMEDGGEAVVGREIGSGGQGIVYIVKYQGREYALKWYFYKNFHDR